MQPEHASSQKQFISRRSTVPAPIPLALGDTALARFLVRVNSALIRISRSLFAYQIFMVVRPLPSLEWLLQQAVETSDTMTQERAAG